MQRAESKLSYICLILNTALKIHMRGLSPQLHLALHSLNRFQGLFQSRPLTPVSSDQGLL